MKSEVYRNMLIVMLVTALTILSIHVSTVHAAIDSDHYEFSNTVTNLSAESFEFNRFNNYPMILNSMSSGAMTFEATVYNDSGYAADGTYVYEGMIAADPYVLPIGTAVYVEVYGAYSYMSGVYTVHDTGGAVYGNVIDIWVPWSYNEMCNFGRRYVTVTVL